MSIINLRTKAAFGGVMGKDGRKAYVGGSYSGSTSTNNQGSGKGYQGGSGAAGSAESKSGGGGGGYNNNTPNVSVSRGSKEFNKKLAEDNARRVQEKLAKDSFRKQQLKDARRLTGNLTFGEKATDVYRYAKKTPSKFRALTLKNLIDKKRKDKQLSLSAFGNFVNTFNPSRVDSEYSYTTPINKDMMGVNEIDYMDFGNYGLTGKNMTDIDRMNRALDQGRNTGNISQTEFEAAFYGPKGKPIFDGSNDNSNQPYIPINYNTGAAEVVEPEEETINYRFGDNQNVIFDDYGTAGYRTTAAEGGIMGTRARRAMGGIMNRVDQRQGYFLGKIVKGVKSAIGGVADAAGKVLKSDVGKLALAGLGTYYMAGGMGLGGAKMFGNTASSTFMGNLGRVGTFIKDNPFRSIGIASAVLPFLAGGAKPNETSFSNRGGSLKNSQGLEGNQAIRDEIYEAYESGDQDRIMQLQKFYGYKLPVLNAVQDISLPSSLPFPNYAEGGRIGKAEGGLMDLGGMEKDYRNDGGFVPIGEYEKKDDVPARLSVNEFVFTADAVRGAGQGDIDKGAEIMENMMENLENGGTVSEESQGNKGAQNMFKTSERLGAVI